MVGETLDFQAYVALYSTEAARTNAEQRHYRALMIDAKMRQLRLRASAGFNLGSLVALAADPPHDVLLLGSYEQSIEARFAARFMPCELYCTSAERDATICNGPCNSPSRMILGRD